MNNTSNYIFRKMIILMMMVFLCLPCTVKRDIKLGLDIPVAGLDNAYKTNPTFVCLHFAKENKQQIVDNKFHKLKNSLDGSVACSTFVPSALLNKKYLFADTHQQSNLPLYIFYEQYLI